MSEAEMKTTYPGAGVADMAARREARAAEQQGDLTVCHGLF